MYMRLSKYVNVLKYRTYSCANCKLVCNVCASVNAEVARYTHSESVVVHIHRHIYIPEFGWFWLKSFAIRQDKEIPK